MNDLSKLLIDRYFEPYQKEDISNIRKKIYSAKSVSESRAQLKKYSPHLAKLKKRYKQLVSERNKLAIRNGHSNFFKYMWNWDKIPQKNISKFNKISQQKYNKIQKEIPVYIKKAEWFQTIFNSFNYESYTNQKTYNLPKDIHKYLIRSNKANQNTLSMINLHPNSKGIYAVDYNFKKRQVNLFYDKRNTTVSGAITLAHEYGHALYCLSLISKNLDPNTKSSYRHEKAAIKTELDFEKTLTLKTRKLLKARFLTTYINNIFEQEVYNNIKLDFDTVYAKATKKVIPNITEKSNPLYSLDLSLIYNPCYSSVYCTVYNKLL